MEYAYPANVVGENYREETDVSLLSLLTKQQQHALANLINENDPDKKRKVIAQSLDFVVNITKRYSDHGLAFYDLIREGNQGLIHALDSFELEDHFHFSAHATRCVRQRIECAIMNQIEPE